jgi:hypothetical protein
MNTNAPKKPELAEMHPEQRELYGRPSLQRRGSLPETVHRYDPFRMYDESVEPCHRKKRDE